MSGNILVRVHGLVIDYKSFVRPVCEYVNVIFMGASAVHLHKLDAVQTAVEKLSDYNSILVISLQGQCHWPAVWAAGFPLSATTPDFLSHPYLCHTPPPSEICYWWSFAAAKFCEAWLTEFIYKQFSGHNPTVWSTIPLSSRERGAIGGWSAVCYLLQRYFHWIISYIITWTDLLAI